MIAMLGKIAYQLAGVLATVLFDDKAIEKGRAHAVRERLGYLEAFHNAGKYIDPRPAITAEDRLADDLYREGLRTSAMLPDGYVLARLRAKEKGEYTDSKLLRDFNIQK